jgi:glycogen debranching enzyme
MPRPTVFIRRLTTLCVALCATARAQPTANARTGAGAGTVPWFDRGASPIALGGDARPNMYLATAGRRSIAMGTEDGRFEMWSWPIKWMHDFQLSFRVPKYPTPIPGRDVARTMDARPEGVTITYAYETFTVRQHVFASLDAPAVIMLLEVDAVRPMEIVASFTPDIHFAWPASLGGQYLVWNQSARAFMFSESRRRINAFLGSPATTQASDVPAHQLTAAPPQFVIGVGSEGDQYIAPRLGEPPGKNVNLRVAYIPIVLAGGEMPRDSARALYDRLSLPGAAEREWKKRVAHADSMRRTTLSIASPEPWLDRAVEWAKVNLDESMVCNPDLGCGLVAGYGLSGGASDRPGFGWFFGGDASINSFAMSGVGQLDLVREGVFRFFAKYQRADGKITHEISQGAGKIRWFEDYPYAFYHGDTTPFWILACGEYWRQSADTALVRELWPNLRKAYEWSRATDTDGDGLMENTKAGAGALEVGDLQIGIVSDVYMSGVWAASLERFARMADAMNEPALATEARAIRAKAITTMESRLWLPSLKQYAFALLEGGKINENMTAWPATAMSFDVFEPARGHDMAMRMASSDLMTDWGARPLASTSTLFDPLHYNNGAVWPFVTGWVALAQYRYHNAHAGKFALDAIARTGFDESRGRNPEVISGRVYKPLDTAVPHQFFATSMVLTPLVRGLLGLDVDGAARTVTFAPHLPPAWDSLRVENVVVGRDRISIALLRTREVVSGRQRVRATVRRATPGRDPIVFSFSPALPLGSRSGDGSALTRTPGDEHARVDGVLRDSLTLVVETLGGWSVMPPNNRTVIGDRSRALRILGERLEGATYGLSVEGRGGERYELRLRGPGTWSAASVPEITAETTPDAQGYRTYLLSFPSSGANADGYVRRELRFTSR